MVLTAGRLECILGGKDRLGKDSACVINEGVQEEARGMQDVYRGVVGETLGHPSLLSQGVL